MNFNNFISQKPVSGNSEHAPAVFFTFQMSPRNPSGCIYLVGLFWVMLQVFGCFVDICCVESIQLCWVYFLVLCVPAAWYLRYSKARHVSDRWGCFLVPGVLCISMCSFELQHVELSGSMYALRGAKSVLSPTVPSLRSTYLKSFSFVNSLCRSILTP